MTDIISEIQGSIDPLINELKNASGLEFDHYQRNFLEKRIKFRMNYLNIEDYQDYINYILDSYLYK